MEYRDIARRATVLNLKSTNPNTADAGDHGLDSQIQSLTNPTNQQYTTLRLYHISALPHAPILSLEGDLRVMFPSHPYYEAHMSNVQSVVVVMTLTLNAGAS